MHQVILFRGGMFGDLILCMLNKEYMRSIYPLRQVRNRVTMKQFYKYSQAEKKMYFEKMDGYTLSHDTDFCKQIDPTHVIQLFCSDENLLPKIERRFWLKNERENVKHVETYLKSMDRSLATDIKLWQEYNVFKNRFDVKNIYKDCFLDDLAKTFEINDHRWAKTIYNIWRS